MKNTSNNTSSAHTPTDAIPAEATVAIIGAGPAGTCCAGALLNAGIEPLILERSTFPRFMIGESFLPRTLTGFEQAGLLEVIEDADFRVKPGAVFCDGSERYRVAFSEADDVRFDHAFNVRRGPFDERLARAVRRRGATLCFGASLDAAEFGDDGWTLTVRQDGQDHRVRADYVADASGGARVVPSLIGKPVERGPAVRGAVFAHLDDPRCPDGFDGDAIWILSEDTTHWGWVIPFANGSASVGFVGESIDTDDDARRVLDDLLDGHLGTRQRFPERVYRRDPISIGISEVPRSDFSGPGYCLIGNSVGFVDPIFSSGMTIATETAIRAARGIAAELGGQDFDWQREYTDYISAGLDVFDECIDSWYDGELRDLLLSNAGSDKVRSQIISILAGRAWNVDNPMTERTKQRIGILSRQLARTP